MSPSAATSLSPSLVHRIGSVPVVTRSTTKLYECRSRNTSMHIANVNDTLVRKRVSMLLAIENPEQLIVHWLRWLFPSFHECLEIQFTDLTQNCQLIITADRTISPSWSLKVMSTNVSRSAYFKSDGPMMEIKMWRPWRQCISPKCLMRHRYPNGPSTECSRSVATATYAYRVVGILRGDKQKRNRSHRKSNCKSFSLGKSQLEVRTKSQLV